MAESGDAPVAAPALHPNLAEVYRERVAGLERALADRKAPEVLEAARALIDCVVVHPPEDPGSPPRIELGLRPPRLRPQAAAIPAGAVRSRFTSSLFSACT